MAKANTAYSRSKRTTTSARDVYVSELLAFLQRAPETARRQSTHFNANEKFRGPDYENRGVGQGVSYSTPCP
jgi:hypothetical protein